MSTKNMKRAPTTAMNRLKQEYLRLKQDPVPYICAEPLLENFLKWHYVMRGPQGTPYEGGYYHGMLDFPKQFPFQPPSIYMITPNGRFECYQALCLSISSHHPETWNPAWSVSAILNGLLSFMVEEKVTHGSIMSTDSTKRQLAASSLTFNLNDAIFCQLFPEVAEEIKGKLEAKHKLAQQGLLKSNHSQNDWEESFNQLGFQHTQWIHRVLGRVLVNAFAIVVIAAFVFIYLSLHFFFFFY